jgi:hypothetical protein
VPATDDTCTTSTLLSATHVMPFTSFLKHDGSSITSVPTNLKVTTLSLLSPSDTTKNTFTVVAPGSKALTGSVDVTLNLSTGGANLPWLQPAVSCESSNTATCNPTARATFGVYSPLGKKNMVNIQNVN